MKPPLKNLRRLKDELTALHGEPWLFAVVRRSKSIHYWDIILSAKWASRSDSALVREIHSLIKETLAAAEAKKMGRVLIVDPADPSMEQFFGRIGGVYDQAQVRLVGPWFGDESIIEAFVLAAKNPRPFAAGEPKARTA